MEDNKKPNQSNVRPPRWADQFLEWYCSPALLDEIQGDLYEAFYLRVKKYGRQKASLLFIKEVCLFCRPSSFKKSFLKRNFPTMLSLFQNHFKTAWRNAFKTKGASLINITGLAIGMAACLLILQYVNFEKSYDQFHENNPNIYRVQLDRIYPDRRDKSAGCTAFLGPALKESMPEIQAYSKLWATKHINNILIHEEHSFLEDQLYYADESFFTLFSYPLLEGDPETALLEPYSIVLTQSVSQKIFGEASPIGKTIEYSGGWGKHAYRVTGLAADVPENTHLKFNTLVSFQTLVQQTDGNAHNGQGWNAFLTYLLFKPGADVKAVAAKLPGFVEENYTVLRERGVGVELHLQALPSIHLKSNLRFEPGTNGNQKIVHILLFAALFILGIAWINYINLATAKSIERVKEIGVRKVIGAGKTDIRRQFMVETILLNLISFLLALVVARIGLPYLNQLTGVNIPQFNFLQNPTYVLGLIGVFCLGVLLSGFYPAFIMSSFSPSHVLSGAAAKIRGVILRKALVVFQFGIAIVLISGSFIIFKQVKYMLNKDIGIDINQTLVLKGPGIRDSVYEYRLERFKERVANHPAVAHVTNSTAVPGKEISWVNNSIRWRKKAETNNVSMPFVGVDYGFFETFDLQPLSGRVFNEDYKADRSNLVLTKAAARLLGFENPKDAINEEVLDAGTPFKIIGVVEDYNQESLSSDYRPVAFRYVKNASSYYSVKLKTDNVEESIASVQKEWKTTFPGNPFSYFFLDEFFDRQYRSDRLFGRLFGLFAALGILVSCMGLLGLSSYTIHKRTKEIGLRKILGASLSQILLLISKEHLVLILAAALLGAPVAYWIMGKWLGNYAFAIELHWQYFLAPVFILVLIAVVTISYHGLKAALANPVEALRYE